MASGSKSKSAKLWVVKISLMTLIISAGLNIIAELFLNDMGILPACAVVLVLIVIGVVFDMIGVAFASCDQVPFIAMSAKKIKKAGKALKLLKKAEMISSVCNDVIGDICSIVSGAAGAAIVAKVLLAAEGASDIAISVGVSALISALTVGGKAMGKTFAMEKNVFIVEAVGSLLSVFDREKRTEKPNGKK